MQHRARLSLPVVLAGLVTMIAGAVLDAWRVGAVASERALSGASCARSELGRAALEAIAVVLAGAGRAAVVAGLMVAVVMVLALVLQPVFSRPTRAVSLLCSRADTPRSSAD